MDMQAIQPHLDRIKAPVSTAKDHHVSNHGPGRHPPRYFSANAEANLTEKEEDLVVLFKSDQSPPPTRVCDRTPLTRWRNLR